MFLIFAFIFVILIIFAYSTRSLLHGFIGVIPFLVISFLANDPFNPYVQQPVWIIYHVVTVAAALGFAKTIFRRRFAPRAAVAVDPVPTDAHSRNVQLSGRILLVLLFTFITTMTGYYVLFTFFKDAGLIHGSDSLFSILADFVSGLILAYSLFAPFWFAFFVRKFKAALIAAIPTLLFSIAVVGDRDGLVYLAVSLVGLLLAFLALLAVSKSFRQTARDKFNYFKSVKITVSAGQKKLG